MTEGRKKKIGGIENHLEKVEMGRLARKGILRKSRGV